MSSLPKTLIILACIVIIGANLSACTSIVSATTDGPVVEDYGKRTPGTVLDDEVIETKIAVNLKQGSEALALAPIKPISYNAVVLLIGQVPNDDLKREASIIAEKVRKVRRVHNELEVGGTPSALSAVNDSWLLAKLKTQMMIHDDIQSNRIQVAVENGVVFLMGLVTQDEAKRATELAQTTSGVRKVVRIFEYIGDGLDKL